MKCNCGSDMRLVFYTSKDGYRFFWGCNEHPNCRSTKDYNTEGVKLNIAENETMTAIEILKNGSEQEKIALINEVKVQMVEILNHFIDCTWGAHYMTLLNEIIIPYLDDPSVLQYVLKGTMIKDYKANVFLGKSGAKMYEELYYCLKRVHSQEIKDYLTQDFQDYFENRQ